MEACSFGRTDENVHGWASSTAFVTDEDHPAGNAQYSPHGRTIVDSCRPWRLGHTRCGRNHEVQIPFVSSPGSVILISCTHRCWRRLR